MAMDIFDILTNLSWVLVWIEYVQRILKTMIGKGNLLVSLLFTLLLIGGSIVIFIANMYTLLVFFQNYVH